MKLFTRIHQAPKTRKCHMLESVEHSTQIDGAETQVTTSCRLADLRNGKTHLTVVQISRLKKMKHDAMDDDEKIIQMMVTQIAWKNMSSTVRFVRIFYRSWTGLFQNPGFETVRINFGWRAQWKVTPWRLEMRHHRTAHLPLS